MLSQEDNDRITRTGPGTPGGAMMRRYWQPAALSRELGADEPLAITLLGEDLVMYRDDQGRPHLIDRYCPHRRSDLSFGRVEDGGLRCIYHGWLMDGAGQVIERPAEGARGRACLKLGTGYPCHEANGLILAYLGPGEPPRLPAFHYLDVPESHVFTMKVRQNCNYLQANEGNIDPAHLSFLHLFLREGVNENLNLRSGALNDVLGEDRSPTIQVEETDFGLRIFAARSYSADTNFVRITNFLMPNSCAIQGSPMTDPRSDPIHENSGYQMNWHVPITDETHWKYVVACRFDAPLDHDFMLSAFAEVGPDYVIDRNRENRFRQDREEMRTRSFAGLGSSFFIHDKCVVETQGAILDRSREHLGTTDLAVVKMRQQLLAAVAAVEAGNEPLMVDRYDGEDSLAELVSLSLELDKAEPLLGGWWRRFFAGGKPLASLMGHRA